MDFQFWCSARHTCTPRMWCGDRAHEPWSKLYLVRRGHAEYGISRDGSEPILRNLEPGRLYLIPGGCRHRHACAGTMVLDWCHFTADDHALGQRLALLGDLVSWPLDEVVPADLRDGVVCGAHHSAAGGLMASGLILQLLARLERSGCHVDSDLLRRLSPALSWLNYHFTEPVSVATLARKVGLKPSRFQQLFHQQYGCGVYARVLALRLAEAQRLLASGDLPVQEVAAKVGYVNPFHFTRLFSRHVGHNPTAWRIRERVRGIAP